jgi:hypothetical protein
MPSGLVFNGVFRPDGGLVLFDHKDKQLHFIDADGKPGERIALAEELLQFPPSVIASTPDGKTVGVVGPAKPKMGQRVVGAQLMTWDANTRKPGLSVESELSDALPPGVETPGAYPTGAATDLDGKRLAATFMLGGQVKGRTGIELRGAIVVWDLTTGKEIFRRATDEPLRAAGFDPQGHVVAAGGSVGGVVVGWDLASGKEVLSLRGHSRPILSFAFGPNGRLATGGEDRVVKLWDLPSQQEIITLDGFAREVTHLAFTKDNRDLVAATGVDILTATLSGGLPNEWPPAEVRIFRGPR